jgi:hypothetical protein
MADTAKHVAPPQLSARDKSYLDRYYKPVCDQAKIFGVDPAFVLGLAFESGFASEGTYLVTGDAFGMTGGSTKHMTRASSPADNVRQFFDNWGSQVRGSGINVQEFVNALQGQDLAGLRVKGWKVYNTENFDKWKRGVTDGIRLMQRDIRIYNSQSKNK